MSWLLLAAAVILAGLAAVHLPMARAFIAELMILVLVATGVGYLLFAPGVLKAVAGLVRQGPACAAEAPTRKTGPSAAERC